MTRTRSLCLLCAALSFAFLATAAQDHAPAKGSAVVAAAAAPQSDEAARAEGEKRFRANCGRCHMAPHKYPPRMMATIVRHMHVRATLTDQDAKLILKYMTE